MSTQNKNENYLNLLEKTAEWSGFTAMLVATILSILDLHISRTKETVVLQPAYSYAAPENQNNRIDETMRREKEETAHSEVSYGQTMRSHPITGKA